MMFSEISLQKTSYYKIIRMIINYETAVYDEKKDATDADDQGDILQFLLGDIKTRFPPPANASKSEELFSKFISGFIGGSVATILNTPFDVVKSRMQNQPKGLHFITVW